jgi:hypothetical protein
MRPWVLVVVGLALIGATDAWRRRRRPVPADRSAVTIPFLRLAA